MTGIITGPIVDNPEITAEGRFAIPSGVWEGSDPFSLTRSLGRYMERQQDWQGPQIGPTPARGPAQHAPPPMLTSDQANEQYGIEGQLNFGDYKSGIPDAVAKNLYHAKLDELRLQDVARRAPSGIWNTAQRVGAGFIANALDPLNIAASFIPVVGEARYAEWLANAGSALGRAGVRAGVGAASGVAGQVPLEALRYGLAKDENADWTATSALLDLAYGAALGGILHAGGGAVGDVVTGRYRAGAPAKPGEAAAPAQSGPETIASAGALVDGKIYTGATHADALAKASEETGQDLNDIFDRMTGHEGFDAEGFVTSTGRYVDRDEAVKIAHRGDQIAQVGDLSPEASRELVLGTGELFAEQLKKPGAEPRPIAEAVAALDPRTQEANFRTALAQSATDRPVEVAPEIAAGIRPSESDLAAANIIAAGGEIRDEPIGHMIMPDGRGVAPLIKGAGIINHYETAIDAGYLPQERMTRGSLTGDSERIVHGLLERGWIRNSSSGGHLSFQVYDINKVRRVLQKVLELYADRSAKSDGTVYIDDIASGKSYRLPVAALQEAKFSLPRALRSAEVFDYPKPEAEHLAPLVDPEPRATSAAPPQLDIALRHTVDPPLLDPTDLAMVKEAEAAETRPAPTAPKPEAKPEGATEGEPQAPRIETPVSPDLAENEALLNNALAEIKKVMLTPEDAAELAAGDVELAKADNLSRAYEAALNCPAVKG